MKFPKNNYTTFMTINNKINIMANHIGEVKFRKTFSNRSE